MNPIFIGLMLIGIFFATFLTFSAITRVKLCAICGGVSATWIILLLLYWLDYFRDPLFIALLMGQTIVGIYYLLERRVKEELLVFRLPFLLSATLAAYGALSKSLGGRNVLLLLALVWVFFGSIYVLRHNKAVKDAFRRLISCCKNW